jgi:hypothetical protein
VHGPAERVQVEAGPDGQPGQREVVPPRAGQRVADGAGIRITGLGHRAPDPCAGITERVGQPRYLGTQGVLEQGPADRQLAAQPVLAELVELRMPVAVRADLDPRPGGLDDLTPGQHLARSVASRVLARVGYPAGGDEDRRREAVLTQQRQRVLVEVSEPVIEGEHHGPGRYRLSRRQHRGQPAGGDGGEAVGSQVAELGAEIRRRDAEPAAARCPRGDVVVHQDRHHDQPLGALSVSLPEPPRPPVPLPWRPPPALPWRTPAPLPWRLSAALPWRTPAP